MNDDGTLAKRVADSGRTICIVPLTFGRVRVTASEPGDRWGWRDGY